MQTLTIILSSAFIATVISSGVTIYISRLGYKDKYYERIIDKRLAAHDEVNLLISILKVSVQDTKSSDRRTYHSIFSNGLDYFYQSTSIAAKDHHSFWLTDETQKALINLNREFFRCKLLYDDLDGDLIEVGRREYQEIASLRDDLEESLLTELPSLHKIDAFLNQKRIERQLYEVDLKKRPGELGS